MRSNLTGNRNLPGRVYQGNCGHQTSSTVLPPGKLDQHNIIVWHVRGAASNWCHNLASSTKYNFVFDSAPLVPLCENMMSSAKPEVHNILNRHQRRTEICPQLTCTAHFMKSVVHVVFKIYNLKDRQTDRHADHNTYLPWQSNDKKQL